MMFSSPLGPNDFTMIFISKILKTKLSSFFMFERLLNKIWLFFIQNCHLFQESIYFTHKMFGRNKIDPFNTVNMCNQFLLVYLAKKVQNYESRGLGKNAMVYRNAINSIKRYPLPIICRAQLASINGIGEFLGEQLQKQIKQHYSAFLDQNLQQKNCQKLPQEKQQQNSRSIALDQRNQEHVEENSENTSKNSKQVGIQYKPRINTANAQFLLALKKLISQNKDQNHKGISREVLQSQVQIKYPAAKNKTWKNIEQTLELNGYILIDKKTQGSKKEKVTYKLTEKGLNYAGTIDKKSKTHEAKNKIANQVKYFKQKAEQRNLQMKKKQSAQNLQSFCLLDDSQQESAKKKLIPKQLSVKEQQVSFDKLVLVIDNRQKKEKAQQVSFFCQKMQKKYKIECSNASINLGDFIWLYDGKVLDYIIQRKKADDLAASILDGRYKDQKYRLKNCGINNIYYVYQGYPSDNCILTQKQLNSALLKTRIKESFKVYRTKDVIQTMNLLNSFHLQIYEEILSRNAKYLCSLDEFNELNSVQRNMTVGSVFALGLMCIPGVGKSAVKLVTQYFKTYRQMYDFLLKFDSNQERLQFLKLLFKGTGMISTLPQMMVQVLFSKGQGSSIQLEGDSNRYIQTQPHHEENIENTFIQTQSQRFQKRRFSIIHQEQFNEQNQIKEYQI